jgi:protein-S-isoprenylcysteine O-methyltransferase Ste14
MPIWIRALLFLIIAPGTLAGLIPWYIAGGNLRPTGDIPPIQWLGLILLVAGWAVLLWCARDFAYKGRGTPAPYDPPRALVTSGLYEFTRNPMYVGVVTAIIGQAVWFWSWQVLAYAVIVAVGFHLRVLLYEEPVLTRSFGDDYVTYCARVPRWIPKPWR